MSQNKSYDLRSAVMDAYSMAAEKPEDEHPFPIGRKFAESLGYPQDLLAEMPSACVDAFAGVSNVSVLADIPVGVTVLDLGCGAGLDSLIAARRVGPTGKVIGVDFSEAMIHRAHQSAAELGIDNVEFYRADADNLPIEDCSIDIALVNGIFNLNLKRDAIFHELARVMRPDGVTYSAELILREPLPTEVQQSKINWFA